MAEWDVGCDARFDYETRVESERERPKEPRVSLSYDSGAPRLPRLKVGAWILGKTLWIPIQGLVCAVM